MATTEPVPFNSDHAVVHAMRDGLYVLSLATAGIATTPADERSILVDGSQYSPSWRALPEGAQVWDKASDVANTGNDPVSAYDDNLTRLLDNWTSDAGYHVEWDEGCLFLVGPDFESEAEPKVCICTHAPGRPDCPVHGTVV